MQTPSSVKETAKSGQYNEQAAQPLHLPGFNSAFTLLLRKSAPLGQKATQIPQPLHHPCSICGWFFAVALAAAATRTTSAAI
jgi:hypothetical protein